MVLPRKPQYSEFASPTTRRRRNTAAVFRHYCCSFVAQSSYIYLLVATLVAIILYQNAALQRQQQQLYTTLHRPLVIHLVDPITGGSVTDNEGEAKQISQLPIIAARTIHLRHYPKPMVLLPSSLVNTKNNQRSEPMALAQSRNAIFENSTRLNSNVGSNDEASSDEDNDNDDGVCESMHPWQKKQSYSCNNLHDLDLTEIQFINCGSSRCAFSVVTTDGSTKATLKIQTYEKDVTKARILKNSQDATSLERLTASPYVSNVYGNCAVSQLTEYSSGGNLHDVIKRSRLGDSNFHDLSPLTKLKIGYQLITAVADLHSFEANKVPSLAHNDICCHQFIFVNGIFKLNDFHLSVFIQKDRKTGEPCTSVPFYHESLVKLRAPEEVPTFRNPQPSVHVDAVDVYMVGDVLYYLHANRWAFEGLSSQEAAARLAQGEPSLIPPQLIVSRNEAVLALTRAIQMCWTSDHRRRPSARKVSDYLKDQLKLQGVDVDAGPIQVSMKPLPSDHRYSDTDFYDNFG